VTTFATNVSGVAASTVTALSTAVADAKTLSVNMAANFPGTTLGNLATSTTSWRSDVADLRVLLEAAISDLSVANQKFVTISNLLGAIDSLD
jgi:hypothetical protein